MPFCRYLRDAPAHFTTAITILLNDARRDAITALFRYGADELPRWRLTSLIRRRRMRRAFPGRACCAWLDDAISRAARDLVTSRGHDDDGPRRHSP